MILGSVIGFGLFLGSEVFVFDFWLFLGGKVFLTVVLGGEVFLAIVLGGEVFVVGFETFLVVGLGEVLWESKSFRVWSV